MGIGPVKLPVPKVLKHANMSLNVDIDLIELNEASASQSLAVIRELNFSHGDCKLMAVLLHKSSVSRMLPPDFLKMT